MPRKALKLKLKSNPREHNFLKHWRVVRYWVKRKYGITTEELEVMLYLYDEDLFTKKQYFEFEGLFSWDKTRWGRFIDSKWIILWRDHKGYSKKAKLYTLSIQAKRIINSVYRKLLQEEPIPETGQNNPIFKGNGYTDKMYRKLIEKMNSKRAEQS